MENLMGPTAGQFLSLIQGYSAEGAMSNVIQQQLSKNTKTRYECSQYNVGLRVVSCLEKYIPLRKTSKHSYLYNIFIK
jgi:hypothetical protein